MAGLHTPVCSVARGAELVPGAGASRARRLRRGTPDLAVRLRFAGQPGGPGDYPDDAARRVAFA
jgi:hypothetical protein